MGWKGTLRSAQAAVRRAEREAKRREKELERRRREYERLEELERARLEVEEYENYIERLVTLHHDATELIDWSSVADSPEPLPPRRKRKFEVLARGALERYRPSLLDKLLRRTEQKRASQAEAVEHGIAKDDANYQEDLRKFEKDLQDWRELRDLALRILKGEPSTTLEVVRNVDPFSELIELGARVELQEEGEGPVHAVLFLPGDDLIPKESKQLLKSGRLSVKALPKGRYYELFQDHVASAVLRVAREVFAILPFDRVLVTAMDRLLNTQTGHLEEQAILSAYIPRSTLDNLRLQSLDPSDSMQNFIHRQEFKKTKGFEAIEPLGIEELPTSGSV